MGLFDKKFCDICGERIRFLGNRKLEDGNLCKDCEAKLSPWFSDRRRSTVQDIRDQLAYREENKKKAEAFKKTLSLGEGNQVWIDEEKQQFIIRRNGQTIHDNPDVLSLSDVTGCEIDIDHSKTEETTRNEEGKSVSYDPPRHTHRYRFYIQLQVNHPWFDDMRFAVNGSSVEIKTGQPKPQPAEPGSILTQLTQALAGTNAPAYVTEPDTEHDENYQKYLRLAESMRDALLRRPEPRAEAAEAKPEKIACPFCSAVTEPDEKGCCPYCGEKII